MHYNKCFSWMEAGVSVKQVLELMRTTRKNDMLFKPLKKIKTALQSIGVQNVSTQPTNRLVIFHFGLGNDLDQEIINSTAPKDLIRPINIIPGHSHCILTFGSIQSATIYTKDMDSLPGRPLFYLNVQYHNLTRLIVAMYYKGEGVGGEEQNNIPNCPPYYQQGSIPGLFVLEEVMSREEEIRLMQLIDDGGWQRLNNRRVQHYGFQFKYGRNQVDPHEHHTPLPQYFQPLLSALANIPQLAHCRFDQLTINDYFAGNGIPAHFDTHSPFQEVFVSVSMLSHIVMDFRKYDGLQRYAYLRPRSVAIFSGQARYAWTHGISCRKMDRVGGQMKGRSRRISLTFRQIRRSPCDCPYYFYCDSQGYDQNTMKKQNPLLAKWMSHKNATRLAEHTPLQIERHFVKQAYNGFGFHFHNRVIEEVRVMLEDIEVGEWVLDVGNGNGEYLKHLREGVLYWGVETCTNMLGNHNQLHMDGRKLGLREQMFDRALVIAVLHHFASHQRRLQLLKEVKRVMRKGGTLYLSVLSYENKKGVYTSPQTLIEYTLPTSDVPKEPNPLPTQQPRKEQKGQVYQRYYHLFTQPELVELFAESQLEIQKIISTKDNLIVRAIKPKE